MDGHEGIYAEMRLKDADGNVSIPDGAVVVERGKTRSSTLVEVRSGNIRQIRRARSGSVDHGPSAA